MGADIKAIDLFCGAGGLSCGLQQAGITIAGGIDVDPRCEFPFTENIRSPFLHEDIQNIRSEHLNTLWGSSIRLLAGCAPCQPFSTQRKGADTSGELSWNLLSEFSRLVNDCLPEFVTMENVPGLLRTSVFTDFVSHLESLNYTVVHKVVFLPDYGLPQSRRRLVLLASKLGSIQIPPGTHNPTNYLTVRDAIGTLPHLANGETSTVDSLHFTRKLTPINLQRIQASTPGGTWQDWPEELRLPCHKRKSGESFTAFYGRMEWDKPSPTITTQPFNIGTGRFGHPQQSRAISLREAALLQGFPEDYQFVPKNKTVSASAVGRMIGNAVPPPLGKILGEQIIAALKN